MFNLQLQFDRIDDFNTKNTNLFIIQKIRKNVKLSFLVWLKMQLHLLEVGPAIFSS